MSDRHKTKIAILKARTGKVTVPPQKMAAQIGQLIARYSYLEWLQANLLHAIMQVSIKQGRVAVKVPAPKQYPNAVAALLSFHNIYLADYPYGNYGKKLDRADRARNLFAHSLFLRDRETRQVRIQIVRGTRGDIDDDALPVFRAINPECPLVTPQFLAERRKDVEDAISETGRLGALVDSALQSSNEKRRQLDGMDRRSRPNKRKQKPPPPPSRR